MFNCTNNSSDLPGGFSRCPLEEFFPNFVTEPDFALSSQFQTESNEIQYFAQTSLVRADWAASQTGDPDLNTGERQESDAGCSAVFHLQRLRWETEKTMIKIPMVVR